MQAVILAGGQGRRLRPYTLVIPKPLLPVADQPIVELLIRQLHADGFHRLTISIGHLGEMVRAFLGDGSRYGVRIEYLIESQPLGTAGPLSLLAADDVEEDFLVLNGDLLTDLDFAALFATHVKEKRLCTIGTYRKPERMELGVLRIQDGRVTDYIEKPVSYYDVSMGVYVFHRDVLAHIPSGVRFDLPDLVKKLIVAGVPVHPYRHEGDWLDIGRFDDHAIADERLRTDAGRFLRSS